MKKDLEALENVLKLIQTIVDKLDQGSNGALAREISASIEVVNEQVYGCKTCLNIPIGEYESNAVLFKEQVKRWMSVLSEELRYRKTISYCNKIDYDFLILSRHIETWSEDDLIDEAKSFLNQIRKNSEENFELIQSQYNHYQYFWGALDLDTGNIDLIRNRVHEIKEHWKDFLWLYDNLEDYRSKKVLYGILRYWLQFDVSYKNSIIESNFDDYFDFDIIQCDENEVFVDAGAFTGDSAASFIDSFGTYKRVYCYEMSSSSMEKARQRLAGCRDIVFRQVGVGNVSGTAHMFEGCDESSNFISEQGGAEIPIVRLDDDITEPISFLKMDIEGSEMEALEGAQQHIRNDKPKLAICSYHTNRHIYEIPKLIKEYNPQYRLYMRYYGRQNAALVSEFVTFAV